jgi:hypothetical protein
MDAPPRWSVEPFDEDADPLDPGEGDGCVGEPDLPEDDER